MAMKAAHIGEVNNETAIIMVIVIIVPDVVHDYCDVSDKKFQLRTCPGRGKQRGLNFKSTVNNSRYIEDEIKLVWNEREISAHNELDCHLGLCDGVHRVNI